MWTFTEMSVLQFQIILQFSNKYIFYLVIHLSLISALVWIRCIEAKTIARECLDY